MATVRCWALHGNINNAISYVLDVKNDGKKTEQQYYECTSGNAYSAGYDWKIKNTKANNDNKIVGFHFQQSFEAGSITPEEAYEISKKWIDEIVGDEYDYVLALHTDKKHIHSHIIVNPVNKKTGKQINIFYKKDLPRYKLISDRMCKEHGLKTLESPEGAGKSYYEWLMKNKGDGLKEVIAKSLDNLINRVSTYHELKKYMESIGFEIEDDIQKEVEDNVFTFTGDIKLVSYQDDEIMTVRLPYSRNYMNVSFEDVKWIKENKTFKITYQNDKPVKIYDQQGNYLRTLNAKDLELNWEKKSVNKQRTGLRIKPPNSKKFIRCNRIEKNVNGEGYSFDDVVNRIENNGRLSCDPEIKKVIESIFTKEDSYSEKSHFFEQADIKEKWQNTRYYTSSKKERYVNWRTHQLQQKINKLQLNKEMAFNIQNLDKMKDELSDLKSEFRNLNDDIRKQENILEDIQNQKMEEVLEITQSEIDEFVEENITPLYKTKKEMYEKMNQLNKIIKQSEKQKKEKRNIEK